MVRFTDALHVIAAAVNGLGLPKPTEYAITTSAIRLGFRSPADVDRWARHIGLHPGCVTTASGEYAAVEFSRCSDDGVGVWCGAEAVTLAAPIAPPDRGSARTAVSVLVLAAAVTLAVAVALAGADTAGWW